jgi:RimJ/RimL family protein N-acetyltransferase
MVSIRPLQQEDFATVYAWENMEELWDVSEQKGPFSPSEIKDFMERCLNPDNDDCERWIISSNNESVGAIDLFDLDRASNSCGVGIFLAHKENRGKGIGSKALRQLLEMIEKRKYTSIRAIVFSSNEASIALFQNNQFTFQAHLIYKGKPAMQFCRTSKQ